jgi:hypothetical protein
MTGKVDWSNAKTNDMKAKEVKDAQEAKKKEVDVKKRGERDRREEETGA